MRISPSSPQSLTKTAPASYAVLQCKVEGWLAPPYLQRGAGAGDGGVEEFAGEDGALRLGHDEEDAGEFTALRLVDRHGKRSLMLW